ASVTLDVTLGNAKTLGKHGVVTLVTPNLPPMCARTRSTRCHTSQAGFFSQWRKKPFRRPPYLVSTAPSRTNPNHPEPFRTIPDHSGPFRTFPDLGIFFL